MKSICFVNLYHLHHQQVQSQHIASPQQEQLFCNYRLHGSPSLLFVASCCLHFLVSHTTPPPMNLLFSSDSCWKPSLHIILVFRVFLILTPSSLLSVFFPAPSLEPPRARAVSPPTVLACNCQPWENEWKAGVSSNDLQSPIQLTCSEYLCINQFETYSSVHRMPEMTQRCTL